MQNFAGTEEISQWTVGKKVFIYTDGHHNWNAQLHFKWLTAYMSVHVANVILWSNNVCMGCGRQACHISTITLGNIRYSKSYAATQTHNICLLTSPIIPSSKEAFKHITSWWKPYSPQGIAYNTATRKDEWLPYGNIYSIWHFIWHVTCIWKQDDTSILYFLIKLPGELYFNSLELYEADYLVGKREDIR